MTESAESDNLSGGDPADAQESQSASLANMGNLAFLLTEEAVSAYPLADCRVRTLESAHARVKPAGERIATIAEGQTLTAMARTYNWFMVLIDGAGHWVAAESVYANGGCQ